MSTILRLEDCTYNQNSVEDDLVNRIFIFNTEYGTINVCNILQTIKIPYTLETSLIKKILLPHLGSGIVNGSDVKIIHNKPVVMAYSAPLKLYLDITSYCSLNCSFCLSSSGSGNQCVHLPMSVILKVADEIEKLGIMYVKIGGGDPFLHPNFTDVITLLHSKGAYITISTNSVSIKQEAIRLLKKTNVRVSVSIEGMRDFNDSVRGCGHFDKAVNVLKEMKKSNINVLLRTTLLRHNLRDVPELVEFAKEMGVKIKFSYCRPAGRAVENKSMLEPIDAKNYLNVLNYLNDSNVLPYVILDEGMVYNQPPEMGTKLLNGRMCGAANRSMHINTNQGVSPCVFLGSDFTSGKIYVDGTIRNFWRGEANDIFDTVRNIKQPQECASCDRLCKNECPASRLFFWGQFDRQDPNCLHEVIKNSV
ncbi:MAG: radical SAM protein [bacterium]